MDEIIKRFLKNPSQMVYDMEIDGNRKLQQQLFRENSELAIEYLSFQDFESLYFVSTDAEKTFILRTMFDKANNIFGNYKLIVEKMPNRLPSDIYEKSVDLLVKLAKSKEEIKWVKQGCLISHEQWDSLFVRKSE